MDACFRVYSFIIDLYTVVPITVLTLSSGGAKGAYIFYSLFGTVKLRFILWKFVVFHVQMFYFLFPSPHEKF